MAKWKICDLMTGTFMPEGDPTLRQRITQVFLLQTKFKGKMVSLLRKTKLNYSFHLCAPEQKEKDQATEKAPCTKTRPISMSTVSSGLFPIRKICHGWRRRHRCALRQQKVVSGDSFVDPDATDPGRELLTHIQVHDGF